jgi:predicted MFS family arabinose efflux permease
VKRVDRRRHKIAGKPRKVTIIHSRWSILSVLFAVRAIMAIQYQSVAGVAPLLSRDLGIDLTDIGVLIGLYMAPGVALALPEESSAAGSGTRPRFWLA